ncbi:MAG TPA: DUF4012 domain-containing protein [Actinomycetota bacterium]
MPDRLDPPAGDPPAPSEEDEEIGADGDWSPETPDMWEGPPVEGDAPAGGAWQPDDAGTWERAAAAAREAREGTAVPSRPPGGGLGDRPHRRRRRSRRSSKARRRRRRILFVTLGIGFFVLAVGAVVADAYQQSYRIYQQLRTLQPEVGRMRQTLAKGRIPPGDPFGTATRLAAQLQSDVDHARFTFRITGALPFVSRPVQAARLSVHAANEDAQAASLVRDMVKQVLGDAALSGSSGDHGAAVFQNGVVDLHLLGGLVPKLQQVESHLELADRDIRAIPSIPFFSNVNALQARAAEESARVTSLVQRATVALKLVPSFLAAGGDRTYFLAFQQNAAQRGTGGSVLAYGLLDVSDGALSLTRFGSIYDIDNPLHGIRVKLPPEVSWYVRNAHVNPRIANGSNYSPDFPTVARAWTAQVSAATGERIDGVIALDPFAVEALMEGNPPVKVEAYPDPIGSKNVVGVVEHDQFQLPPKQQNALPSELIHRTFTRLLSGEASFVKMVQAIGASLSDRRLQMWTDRPSEQAFLAKLGWDGALHPAEGDYLDLAMENRIGNKLDYFLNQSIDYTATVRDDGSVSSVYRVTVRNNVPTPIPHGQPGLYGPPRFSGLVREMMNLYVPKGSTFRSVEPTEVTGPGAAKVQPPGFVQHLEDAFRVFTQTITAGPRESVPLTYRYTVPDAIRSTSEGHVYQLTVQHQPLVRAADLTVHVVLPKGAKPVLTPGWRLQGNVATFHASLARDLTLRLVY